MRANEPLTKEGGMAVDFIALRLRAPNAQTNR
jgi:hypothetical protein